MGISKILQVRWVLMTVLVMILLDTLEGQDGGDEAEGGESETEEDEADKTDEDGDTGSEEGTSTAVIVLAVLLATLVMGNLACALWCSARWRQTPPIRLPHHGSGITAGVELDTLRQRVATEQSMCQSAKAELETERDKRVYYEALVLRKRSEREGVRTDSSFPSVYAVVQDVKHRLVNDALTWSETVSALCESQPGLPATIQAVLEHTFNVCREEATRCLDERLGAFKQCLGKDEPISLSGDIPMKLDTEYVLYECLRRNHQTVVSMKPHSMKNLAATIVQRCGRHENLAGAITSNNAWRSFNALMEHYLQVFVDMALQKPPMGFKGDVGTSTIFDETRHLDWAPCFTAPPVRQQCTIVFPSIVLEGGRVKSDVKIGVVRVPI